MGAANTKWRVTSANLNLNRDYAKADSPEMRVCRRIAKDQGGRLLVRETVVTLTLPAAGSTFDG